MKNSRGNTHVPLLTAIVLLIAAVMVTQRGIMHVDVGDELRYYFRFDLKPGQNYFNFNRLERVKSLPDVVSSQVNHYQCVNGRTPVHFIEQCFSAAGATRVFHPINALIFTLTLLLFLRLCLGREHYLNPLAALLAAIAFLYLFPVPARLWTSINLSLNYLWPSCATLGVLLALQRITADGWKPSRKAAASLCLLGFFTGWSNESFSFPLSGALALYFALNIRKFNASARWLVIPLWTGALIMLASPGNWIRARQAVDHVATFWDVLLQLKLLWIALACLALCICARPRRTIAFLKANLITAVSLLLAVAMGVIAHTASRGFTSIELFSAILLATAWRPFVRPVAGRITIASGVLLALFAISQTAILIEHRRQYRSIADATRDYMRSPTGTVRYDYSAPPVWLAPFVYSQVPATDGADYEWRLLGISRGSGRKPFMALRPELYDNIDTLRGTSPDTSAIHPFTGIAGALVAPFDSTLHSRYKALAADGRSATIAIRLFYSPGRQKYVTLIPPDENFHIIKVKPVKNKKLNNGHTHTR